MPKKKKKKTNPNRLPQTTVDRINNRRDAMGALVTIIFLSTLVDKFGMSKEDLKKVFDSAVYLSESIGQGRVNAADLVKMLREEYDIIL